MGGNKSKKKNCSGCKGYHRGPWGPNQCLYMQKSPPDSGRRGSVPGSKGVTPPSPPPPNPLHGLPPKLADDKGGGGAFKDNAAYMEYLENRIHQWEDFH